jgi:copper(I)-binding protein
VSRSLRRGALAATLALAVLPLSACAAGNDAETLQIKPDNPSVTVGDIEVHNAVVITDPKSGGPATLSASLVNNADKPQTLDSVTLHGVSKPVKVSPATLSIPAHGSVLLGGKGNPSATIESPSESMQLGNFQRVTFKFSETGDVALPASVVPATGYYKPFGPSAQAPAPAGGSPAAAPSGSPSGSPSASASASATAGHAGSEADAEASPSASKKAKKKASKASESASPSAGTEHSSH